MRSLGKFTGSVWVGGLEAAKTFEAGTGKDSLTSSLDKVQSFSASAYRSDDGDKKNTSRWETSSKYRIGGGGHHTFVVSMTFRQLRSRMICEYNNERRI